MADSSGLYAHLFQNRPPSWDLIPFAEAVDFQEGPGILAKDFCDVGVPLLRLRNIQRSVVDPNGCDFLDPNIVHKRWDHFRIRLGDLLVSTSGTIGRVSKVGHDAVGSIPYTGIIRMRPATPRIVANFIAYYLRSPLFQIQAEAMASGSVLQHYGPSHLRKMVFPVPPEREQHAIAEVLGSLDDKIERNRQTNKTLEEMASAIFKAWFVDFEPVKAKAAGAKSFPSMPQEVFDSLPSELVEDSRAPGGVIPKGWNVAQLTDIVAETRHGVDPSDLDPATPYMGMEHMPRGSVCLNECGQATDVTSQKIRFETGDILFGKIRPYFKKVGMAHHQGVCSSDIAVARPREKAAGWIALWTMASDPFIDHCVACSNGDKMPRVRWGDMARFQIALPPNSQVAAMTTFFDTAFHAMAAHVEESQTLAELRDTLLPKLLSGEVRVSQAEKLVS
ncbi:MAG: restriction endonuclease subunit S [Phycisphaerae bacterium]